MSVSFGVFGGDRRQVYLARFLRQAGLSVHTAALGLPEDLPPSVLPDRCSAVVLPLPLTRDGETLHAPLAPAPVPLTDDLARGLSRCRLFFGGRPASAPAAWQALPGENYAADPAFLRGNAVLTARAALPELLLHTPGGLPGARVLVLGWGRIAQALAPLLAELGAQVTCAARRPEARQAIRQAGFAPADFSLQAPFDALVNTVPALVAGESLLSCQAPDALLLELASAPGGFDRPAAARLGLPVTDAPGLPGRRAPREAGRLLQTILERSLR